MNPFLLNLPAWLAGSPWIAPFVGGVVCGLAMLVGWRFLTGWSGHRRSSQDSEGIDANFLQGVTRDRRVAPRRRGNTIEVELLNPNEIAPIRAWILDRSIGGLCLLLDQPLQVGVVLKVRPKTAQDSSPWTDITIRSCREDAGQYEVGCQFHQMPNWGQMLQFG